MALNNDEIISLIEKGTSDKIRLSRKRSKKVNMHVTGLKVKEYLEDLDDYETAGQKLLREKLVKSNRSLFSFILRPTDKIFTAKGGSINYNLRQDRVSFLKDSISDISDGVDIKKFLKKVVRSQYIIDPNGILFIDISPEGLLETHVINTSQILWYSNKGNKIKGIIFEPYTLDEDNKKVRKKEGSVEFNRGNQKKYYRVIDENSDRIYVKEGNTITEDKSQSLPNFFKFVPAIILGDEKNPNLDIFESIIDPLIEDADEMLRDISVKTVHKLAHAYPRYWSYEQACIRCNGEGQIVLDKEAEPPTYQECTSCGGDGVKKRSSPSDEIVLPVPGDGDTVIAPDVAGFSSPDLETAKFYESMMDKARNMMFQAMWGTTHEQGGKRETATGRFLDSQPVQDRLRDISNTFEGLHKFLLDAYGKVLLNNINYESSVSYGTRYILDSPDDILDKYIEVSRESVSEITHLDLRNRYYEAEYETDSVELLKRKKLSRIEPFPTMKPIDIVDLGLPEDDVKRKMYFSTWIGTLSDAQVIFLPDKRLLELLDQFIKEKTINIKSNNNE